MPTYDARQVELFVYTYKQGVLSAVAHDLKLRAAELSLQVDVDEAPGTAEVRAVAMTVQPRGLRVIAAMREGREAPGVLSASDRAKIERTLATEVLGIRRYPEITFRSTAIEPRPSGQSVRLTGALTLHGVTRQIVTDVRVGDDAWEAEVPLHQPDFGVVPYTAMLGTLRVAPTLRVTVRVPRG